MKTYTVLDIAHITFYLLKNEFPFTITEIVPF